MDNLESGHEFDKMLEMSRAELIVDISEDALALIRALEIQREPDAEENTYDYDVTDGNFRIPDTIKAIAGAGELEYFTVSFTRDIETEEASSEVCFLYRLPNGEPSTFIARHYARRYETQTYTVEQLVGRDGQPVPHPVEVPCSEISRLFASIVYPSKDGDYSLFNSADHNDTNIIKSFDDVLSKHSTRKLREVTYWLENELGQLTRFQYDAENDTPISITLTREETDKDSRYVTSIDYQPGRSHEYADDTMESEADGIHMQIGKGEEVRRYNPTNGDLITLDHSLKELARPMTVPVETLEDMDRRTTLDDDPFDND